MTEVVNLAPVGTGVAEGTASIDLPPQPESPANKRKAASQIRSIISNRSAGADAVPTTLQTA